METVITSVLEESLSRIERAFQQHGFVLAGDLADRHGALQLTFVKETKGLARLVLLSEAVGTGEDDYRGSVDVVVQADGRFARRRVVESHSREAFEREVAGAAIAAAVALADSLHEENLAGSFALRLKGSDELPADEDAELTREARELLERLKKSFDEESLRTYIDLHVGGLCSTQEFAKRLGVSVQSVRALDRKLATMRARWNRH